MDSGLDWSASGRAEESAGLMRATGRLEAISSDAPLARRERQKNIWFCHSGLCLVMFSRRLGQFEALKLAALVSLRQSRAA